MIRVSHILLHVADLDRAVDFYTRVLGMAVGERGALKDGRPLVVLRSGVGLTVFPPGGGSRPPSFDHLAFRVADVAPVLQALAAAGMAVQDGPRPGPYGTSVYFFDPDGYRLECHDGDRSF